MALNLNECKGQWALVTGASSGIGREFCVQLAAAGMNIIMVARRQDLLDALATELNRRHQTQTLVLPLDLRNTSVAQEAKRLVTAKGIRIRLLVNNAAFGQWGRFESAAAEVYEQMLRVNNSALVSMCHSFLPDLATHPTSAIINVSSQAAYQPVPFMAVYAASKAFVQSFSQALYGEWQDRGVLVQTLVPGPTATEFDARAGAYESAVKQRGAAADVVATSLKHIGVNEPVATTIGTYTQRLFVGLFPAKMVIREVGKMFRPPE